MSRPAIGYAFHREFDPSEVVTHARRAEELGYDEFWVIEDCFFSAGVTLAAAALTATEAITVGIGIAPAVARNPAITAMEFATLARLAPGRFHGGIGHGVQSWMAQMGVRPASPLTALDETITAVRALLHGERVSVEGRYVTLNDVALQPAPAQPPLVSAGVRGPKSLALAGRVADGTIMADFCNADYVRWARTQIATDNHRVTVLASMGVGLDEEARSGCREGMGFHLAEVAQDAPISLRMAPFFADLEARAEQVGWVEAAQGLSAADWATVGAVGSPDDAAGYIRSMAEAGTDAITFFPSPFQPLDDAETLARTVFPLL